MTKMKSKKMTKSTFAIIIMAIVMVAMLAFGGTYAYFTATSDQNAAKLTTGKVALKNGSTYTATLTNVMPKDPIFGEGTIQFSTDGSTDATYVAFEVEVKTRPAGSEESVAYTPLTAAELADLGLVLKFDTDVWKETAVNSQKYVKMETVAAGDPVVLNDEAIVFEAGENNAESENDSNLKVMGKEIVITFKGYSIQAKNLDENEDISTAAKLYDVITGAVADNTPANP